MQKVRAGVAVPVVDSRKEGNRQNLPKTPVAPFRTGRDLWPAGDTTTRTSGRGTSGLLGAKKALQGDRLKIIKK